MESRCSVEIKASKRVRAKAGVKKGQVYQCREDMGLLSQRLDEVSVPKIYLTWQKNRDMNITRYNGHQNVHIHEKIGNVKNSS